MAGRRARRGTISQEANKSRLASQIRFVGYALAKPKSPKTKTPQLGHPLQFEFTQKLGMSIAATYITTLATRSSRHIALAVMDQKTPGRLS
jgi:hypothetical protein